MGFAFVFGGADAVVWLQPSNSVSRTLPIQGGEGGQGGIAGLVGLAGVAKAEGEVRMGGEGAAPLP